MSAIGASGRGVARASQWPRTTRVGAVQARREGVDDCRLAGPRLSAEKDDATLS